MYFHLRRGHSGGTVPVVQRLACDGGEALDAEFLAPMDLASYALRARLPGGRRRERNEAMENRLAETVKAAERILTDRESASATH